MGVATAIAISAQSQASFAEIEANDAKIKACESIIQTYDAHGASVEAMRNYADCVRTLYPSSLSGLDILGIKIVIVATIAGVIGGIIYERRSKWSHHDWVDKICWGFLGGIVGFVAILLLACTVGGLYFLVMQ